MKKILAALVVSAAAFALPLSTNAQGFQGPTASGGGFEGPTTAAGVTSAAQAKKSRDDTAAVLTGNIVSRVAGKDDKYVFRDSTGEITVEIDDKYFAGRTVRPENTVRISGEVEKELFEEAEIDVKRLEILK